MVFAIIFLYISAIIDLSVRWRLVNYAFIKNGWNFWEVFLGWQDTVASCLWIVVVDEITATIATIIADTIMVSYCEASLMWRVLLCSIDYADLAMLDCLGQAVVGCASP